MARANNVKALIFDVFGTVVDWRTSIKKGIQNIIPKKLTEEELESFAVEWRSGYSEYLKTFNDGNIIWKKIDEVHLSKLKEILINRNLIDLLDNKKINQLNLLWHKLDPWSDSVEGLSLLKKNYSIGTLSNGNFSLLLNMSKFSKLSWDFIFSGDIFKNYKPNENVYKEACKFLDLDYNEVALVAAHENDLLAAKKVGLKTFYVERKDEFRIYDEPTHLHEFDIIAKNFLDLNNKL